MSNFSLCNIKKCSNGQNMLFGRSKIREFFQYFQKLLKKNVKICLFFAVCNRFLPFFSPKAQRLLINPRNLGAYCLFELPKTQREAGPNLFSCFFLAQNEL